jgi:tagatose 6-phosphate kinase
VPSGQTDRQVLTVTLNAALDLTYASAVFRWGEQNRVEEVHSRAGGKGVNVARVLAQLGVDCMVTGLAGGPTGRAIRESLDAEGLEPELVEIAADSRRTVVAVSSSTGEVTEFDEPGPVVGFEEWQAFEARFEELVRRRRAVVLAGSLPRGLPAEAYRRLAEAAADHGVPVVLDTSGPSLLAGLAGRPSLVKPNVKELMEAAAGREGSTEVVDMARELQRGAQGLRTSQATRWAPGTRSSPPSWPECSKADPGRSVSAKPPRSRPPPSPTRWPAGSTPAGSRNCWR